MKRREFIAALGAAAWPVVSRAQQLAMPVIGFLNNGTPEGMANYVAGFRKGLSELGYVEGRNVAIEYRWGDSNDARLAELARELAGLRTAVIVAAANNAAVAAKAATTLIPIVFVTGGDPVRIGLVASYNRPGGNVTGVNTRTAELGTKRVGLIRELLPHARRLAFLFDPRTLNADLILRDVQQASAGVGIVLDVVPVTSNGEIDAALGSRTRESVDAVLIAAQPFFVTRRAQIVTLAARYMMPVLYPSRTYTDDGGLISYGSNQGEEWRQAGIYVGRILKGEKPADMPVVQPTKFELVINLKTARALGLTIPKPCSPPPTR
jgi:putative ABC transport system substrate-binding protein